MAIASDVILLWPSTVASIPANWARETTLDGKFPKATADATNPNDTGGAATHSHTSPAHSHTMVNHFHTVTLNDIGSYSSNSSDQSGSESPPGHHHHQSQIGGVAGGGLSSVASTYDSVSNNPPYFDLIFIKSNGSGDVEDGIIVLWNNAAVPTGWNFCDGANGTPDLRNKYIHGAATGANAGAEGGGTTNTHILTHTHVESSHTHSGSSGGGLVDGGFRRATSGNNRLVGGHTHNVTLNANTAGSISTPTLVTAETVEPAFKKIMAIKNNSGGVDQPQALIGMWLGTLAAIPAGWSLCDGTNGTPDLRSKYIKIAQSSGELGNTGGSNAHTHAAQAHNHTGGSHTHTGNNTNDHWGLNAHGPVGGSLDLQDGGSAHSVQSVAPATASWNNSNTTADSASNEPEFRTVAYIMWTGTPIQDEREAEVTGHEAANDSRPAEITGVAPAEERPAELTGAAESNSERYAEISGKLYWRPENEPEIED